MQNIQPFSVNNAITLFMSMALIMAILLRGSK